MLRNITSIKPIVIARWWWHSGGRGRQISRVRVHTGLQSEFQDSQGCTEKPCLKNKTKINKTHNQYKGYS